MSWASEPYRSIARLSARALAAGGATSSITARRSVATGEVVFPVSDIDLLAVVPDDVAASGAKLTELLQRLCWVRWLSPRLKHVEVQSARGLRQMAELDTFWASAERRSTLTLTGEPLAIPEVEVLPKDAVARFGLWTEWFFPNALQMESGRNIHKTALECWNAYAVAEGLATEPSVLRSDMEAALRRATPECDVERLRDAAYAASFVFALAKRLHDSRLPALRPLREPLMFDVTIAPLSMRRLFVVLPHADYPLPNSASSQGAWPCTPELLNLFIRYKNPFLYWSLPEDLTWLGMEPPSRGQFLTACRYYGHERFLTTPGFASQFLHAQAARLNHIEHALGSVVAGRVPEPLSEGRVDETAGGKAVCLEYYRSSYDSLRARSSRLEDIAASIAE